MGEKAQRACSREEGRLVNIKESVFCLLTFTKYLLQNLIKVLLRYPLVV